MNSVYGFDHSVLKGMMSLDQDGKVFAEYIWIGNGGAKEFEGTSQDIRSKCKVLDKKPKGLSDLPDWNYDGSSTGQAPGNDSEVHIKPRAIFRDPFRGGDNVLVMTDTYDSKGNPLPTNHRAPADQIFKQAGSHEPLFGLEQEYTVFHLDKTKPLGFPQGGFPAPQGPYYCSAGADKAAGRHLVEAHLKACLYAGIKISGINSEVMPGQWEFQVGPCAGIDAADQLWVARYILHRLAEYFDVVVTFHPKPVSVGDWNGAGCHTNFSTKEMRAKGGYALIEKAVEKLSKKHQQHIEVYGDLNHLRLTGKHETASMDKFTSGVGDRGASVRIPTSTFKDQCGYIEDRRPGANMDPYQVMSLMFKTIILDD